jgi:ParB-like chromosome segregation protein Spo0J
MSRFRTIEVKRSSPRPRRNKRRKAEDAPDGELIQISLIRRDEEARIDEKKVEMLRQAIEMGREIRPIFVARLDDGTYRIVGDGRHRCEAHIRAGCTQIEAVVVNR